MAWQQQCVFLRRHVLSALPVLDVCIIFPCWWTFILACRVCRNLLTEICRYQGLERSCRAGHPLWDPWPGFGSRRAALHWPGEMGARSRGWDGQGLELTLSGAWSWGSEHSPWAAHTIHSSQQRWALHQLTLRGWTGHLAAGRLLTLTPSHSRIGVN